MSGLSTQTLADCLAHNVLFNGLSSSRVARVARVAHWREYEPMQPLVELGESAFAAFAIDRGEVALTVPLALGDRARTITAELKGPHSIVAWSALVAPHRCTTGAHARTRTRVAVLQRDLLAPIFADDPEFEARVMMNLARVIASRLARWQAIALRSLSDSATEHAAATALDRKPFLRARPAE